MCLLGSSCQVDMVTASFDLPEMLWQVPNPKYASPSDLVLWLSANGILRVMVSIHANCSWGGGPPFQLLCPITGELVNTFCTCVVIQVGVNRIHIVKKSGLVLCHLVCWEGSWGISICKWISTWHVASHVCFIHESIMTSCRIIGASNNCPHRPNSSLILSPLVRSRKPVRSWGWLENFRSMCICVSVCSAKRLGILIPQNLRGCTPVHEEMS